MANTPSVSIFRMGSGEARRVMEGSDTVEAIIRTDGIDYVKSQLMASTENKGVRIGDVKDSIVQIGNQEGSHSITSSHSQKTNAPTSTQTSMIKKIVIVVAGTVLAALILWYFFGLKP